MAVCPKCSYSLVLLEHRSKYKCALCSRLFPQKEIDDREFREKNKKQRILDAEDYERELKTKRAQLRTMRKYMKYLFNGIPEYLKTYKEENKLIKKLVVANEWKKLGKEGREQIRDIKKQLRYLFNGLPKSPKECSKEYRLKNREKYLRRKQEYYQKNKQIISLKEKTRRKNNLQLHNQRKRDWRNKNLETMRTYGLIQHYRKKQKALALQHLKNDEYKPSSAEILHSVPTYSLSYLLFWQKQL